MKHKIRILLVLVGIIALLGAYGLFVQNKAIEQKDILEYKLEGRKVRLLIADSDHEMAQGLMYFRSLPDVDGMIFLFPIKNYQTFWNKNTFMDLDVYWIDGDTVVGKSELPSIEKSKDLVYISSPQPVTKVIELVR